MEEQAVNYYNSWKNYDIKELFPELGNEEYQNNVKKLEKGIKFTLISKP